VRCHDVRFNNRGRFSVGNPLISIRKRPKPAGEWIARRMRVCES